MAKICVESTRVEPDIGSNPYRYYNRFLILPDSSSIQVRMECPISGLVVRGSHPDLLHELVNVDPRAHPRLASLRALIQSRRYPSY
jgi:hypothetical protein